MAKYQYRILGTALEAQIVSSMPFDQFLCEGVKEVAGDRSFRWKPDRMAVYVLTDDAMWLPIHNAPDPRPTAFPMPPIQWNQMSWRDYDWLGRQAIEAYQLLEDEQKKASIERAVVGTEYQLIFDYYARDRFADKASANAAYDRFHTSKKINQMYNKMAPVIGKYLANTYSPEQISEIVAILFYAAPKVLQPV